MAGGTWFSLACSSKQTCGTHDFNDLKTNIFCFTSRNFFLLLGEPDHGSLQQELTVSADRGRQCVDITITDDDVPEQNEFFQITLSNIQLVEATFRYVYQLHTPSATVTIVDDDCKITAVHVNI